MFAGWLQGHDARTEVPPLGLIAGKQRRGRPYIYPEAEVAMIVARAAKLPSRYGIRGWTCSTLFGLIAVTGLRINEAIALDEGDVDLDEGVITVKRGKNGMARFVPLAPSTVARLRAYCAERTRLLGPTTGPFFLIESGERPTDCCARYNFAIVSQDLGLREPQSFCKHGRGPRIHDLRHTFAVRTIMGLVPQGARSRSRDDQAQHLPRPLQAGKYLLVHRGRAGTAATRVGACRTIPCSERVSEGRCAMKTHALAPYLQRFFTERLGTQLKASPNTIISYRDTFRVLLRYAAQQLKKAPTALQIADIDADLVGLFLAHIEKMRSNAARSRNTRLSGIRNSDMSRDSARSRSAKCR